MALRLLIGLLAASLASPALLIAAPDGPEAPTTRNAPRGESTDLGVVVDDGLAFVEPGAHAYEVAVANVGSTNVGFATLSCILPAPLTACQWTCQATAGTCSAAGSGNIADTLSLDIGGTAVYHVTCTLPAEVYGLVTVTATVTADKGNPDTNSSNDTDSDTTEVVDIVFVDGFESGDIHLWSWTLPGFARPETW